MGAASATTFDTNVAIHAFADAGEKAVAARTVIGRADFVSVQVLGEFANVANRKHNRQWPEIRAAVDRLRRAVPAVQPVNELAHLEALRLVERYRIGWYDALMLGVALLGEARTFYSEDLQHGMTIDNRLRVVNPFLPGALD